jgi:outer membrane lipoprotein-sorting protein
MTSLLAFSRACLVTLAAAAVMCTFAGAATQGQAAATPTAEEIVARHVTARGGIEKIRAIMSLRESGRMNAGPNRTALVTRELKRPSRSRIRFTVQGVTSVYVSDGQHGWRLSPFEGDVEPHPLPEEAVSEAVEQADIEGPLVDWKAKGHQVELVGREPVGGRDAWKLKLTLKSGAVRHEYLDVTTYERLRSDSTRTVRGRPVQVQTTFSDYRKKGGVLFPRHVEVTAAGRPQRFSITVDKVEVNPPLSDTLFEMPAAPAP